MKKNIKILSTIILLSVSFLFTEGCTREERDNDDAINNHNDNNNELVEQRLTRFDSLDFQFYNNQQWDSFTVSHDENIKVYYPDGTITEGLYPEHIDMLTPLFSFAPDTKIINHPVRFGTGEWTTVIGEMEGTFSKPMKTPDGKTIQPTGKKFKLSMATIGKWKDGKMVEEYLFWDNLAMMKQIGLAQ